MFEFLFSPLVVPFGKDVKPFKGRALVAEVNP